MALTVQQMAQALAGLMRTWSMTAEPVAAIKPDLQAAAAGLDAYFDANAVAINQAIPQPARANLTTSQKAMIVAFLALKRAGKPVPQE